MGTIFFNPGGPGGTGSAQFPQWINAFPEELRARFEIVSWDPRGIGKSTPVQCYDSPEELGSALETVNDYPADDAAKQAWLSSWAAIDEACGARNGDLLAHVSTTDTARDLDALRASLGEAKVNFLGVSYGTYLGAVYANLFPANVRAMVLDANLSPNAWTNEGRPATRSINSRIGSDRAVADNINAFLRFCGEAPTSACAFSAGSADATAAKYEQLLGQLRALPVTTPTGDVITAQKLSRDLGDRMNFVHASFGAPGWTEAAAGLEEIWQLATTSSTPPASSEAPSSATVSSDADSSSPTASSAPATQTYTGPEQVWAVICGDAATPPASAWPAIGDEALQQYGPTAAGQVWGDAVCVNWPTKTAAPYEGPWTADTGITVLLIGNTHDASTPFSNTEEMAKILPRTSIVTVEGYGHTALLNPSSCAAAHEVAYLINGTVPPAGTVCQQDRAPFGSP